MLVTFNPNCISTETVVMQTCQNVTLYICSLSCLNYGRIDGH